MTRTPAMASTVGTMHTTASAGATKGCSQRPGIFLMGYFAMQIAIFTTSWPTYLEGPLWAWAIRAWDPSPININSDLLASHMISSNAKEIQEPGNLIWDPSSPKDGPKTKPGASETHRGPRAMSLSHMYLGSRFGGR